MIKTIVYNIEKCKRNNFDLIKTLNSLNIILKEYDYITIRILKKLDLCFYLLSY